jgi:hypothetical protein
MTVDRRGFRQHRRTADVSPPAFDNNERRKCAVAITLGMTNAPALQAKAA